MKRETKLDENIIDGKIIKSAITAFVAVFALGFKLGTMKDDIVDIISDITSEDIEVPVRAYKCTDEQLDNISRDLKIEFDRRSFEVSEGILISLNPNDIDTSLRLTC